MNIKKRLNEIKKAVLPNGIPENEKLQIIVGRSIDGRFIPNDSHDTVEQREANIKAKYGTASGVVFIKLIDRFGKKQV